MARDEHRDEVRANGPEVARHRSRKNTRFWCKGRPGVEHVREIRISAWAQRWLVDAQGRPPCCPPEWGGPSSWFCNHEEVCRTCGKILRPTLGVSCPDKP